MKRQLDPKQLTEDVNGNNAAVTCPSCSKVYIVSRFINRKGLKCPKCGGSEVIFEKKKDGRMAPMISWEKGTAKTGSETKSPEPPEPKSKTGRMIILKNPEDED
jgi:hypothetical protein